MLLVWIGTVMLLPSISTLREGLGSGGSVSAAMTSKMDSKVLRINNFLESECAKLNVIYIDNDLFFRDSTGSRLHSLFRSPFNIHPSNDIGTRTLEDSFSCAISGFYMSCSDF